MKNNKPSLCCVHHRCMLYQSIKTEEWLEDMAHKGFSLVDVQASRYRFHEASPQTCKYFVMNPESGTDSDSWVFYEFAARLGQCIPCTGNSVLSPRLILRAKCDGTAEQRDLIAYYYQYRNYRLLKRFKRNAATAGIFMLLGILAATSGSPEYAVLMLPFLFVSGAFLFYFVFSYFSFRRDCLSRGFVKPNKKPRRPGY